MKLVRIHMINSMGEPIYVDIEIDMYYGIGQIIGVSDNIVLGKGLLGMAFKKDSNVKGRYFNYAIPARKFKVVTKPWKITDYEFRPQDKTLEGRVPKKEEAE